MAIPLVVEHVSSHLEQIVRGVRLDRNGRLFWFGHLLSSPSWWERRHRLAGATSARLHRHLQWKLYNDVYTTGDAGAPRWRVSSNLEENAQEFQARLAEANHGRGYPIWARYVERSDAAKLIVDHEGIRYRAGPADFKDLPDERKPGDLLCLRAAKGTSRYSPGFYLAFGDTRPASARSNLIRFYWNLTPEGAPALLAEVTKGLNALNLPFQVKTLLDPRSYTRADSAVLYLEHEHVREASPVIHSAMRRVETELRPAVPAFTRPIARGVAWAEDPGNGESFGVHRTSLIAEALLTAHEQGKSTDRARLDAIETRFASEGIDIQNLHLRSRGSAAHLVLDELFPRDRAPPADAEGRSMGRPSSPTVPSCVEIANSIGLRLLDEAVWHEGLCTWVGSEPAGSQSAEGQIVTSVRALGPELYDGTSGIALFLMRLFEATGDERFRRCALGALRQALLTIQSTAPGDRFGLYHGWLGVAFAAASASGPLGDPSLRDQAAETARRALSSQPDAQPPVFDIVSGLAGGILALLSLDPLLPGEGLLKHAVSLGEELLATAQSSERGLSWGLDPGAPSRPHLLGFSHGSGGAAWALMALSRLCSRQDFADAANDAFSFEKNWFDDANQNWPDFRRLKKTPKNTRHCTYSTYWCHGAPGIALSRIRALSLFPRNQGWRDELEAALETTATHIERGLKSGDENYSLCHGLAGNAEILAEGRRALELQNGRFDALVQRVADEGFAQHGQRGSWPCGTGGQQTQGLMLGLGGIGYFYLRLSRPSIPSLLALDPVGQS